MKWLSIMALLLFSISLAAQDVDKNVNKHEPPILGPHWARGIERQQPATSSPDMTYHGGIILPSDTTTAIFWGSSWGTYTGDKISGLDKWYKYVGTSSGGNGSSYSATVNEYNDSPGQYVTTAITYQGYIVDARSLPKHLSTSAVLAEVCKVVTKPVANGYYPVYVDKKRGGANHLDGDAGCDPQSTITNQWQGLAALANVTGHEFSETRSDPNGNAWYDNSGAENGDKCAWVFGGPYVTFLDGTEWKIQGNWSNYAYDHNTGYANSSGQKGCVDGTNYPGPYTK